MINTVDYSFDYFKKHKDDIDSLKEVKEQYNPYVNNNGTVLCKNTYLNITNSYCRKRLRNCCRR